MFGRKRRRRDQQEADEFVTRLAEVNREIDRRPLGQIDLRDVPSPPVVIADDERAHVDH